MGISTVIIPHRACIDVHLANMVALTIKSGSLGEDRCHLEILTRIKPPRKSVSTTVPGGRENNRKIIGNVGHKAVITSGWLNLQLVEKYCQSDLDFISPPLVPSGLDVLEPPFGRRQWVGSASGTQASPYC
jgi:hypothetical protein